MPGAARKRERAARHAAEATSSVASALTTATKSDSQFDGPTGHERDQSRGRRMSNAPPTSSSRTSSRAASAVRRSFFDPTRPNLMNRNIDFPANAYNLFSEVSLYISLLFHFI